MPRPGSWTIAGRSESFTGQRGLASPREPGMLLCGRGRQRTLSTRQPGGAEASHQSDADDEGRPLPWGSVPTLLSADTHGGPIFAPSLLPVVQLQVKLRAPTHGQM